MNRKRFITDSFLFVIIVGCLSASCDYPNKQASAQAFNLKRSNSENLELIHATIQGELNGETHNIVQIGERLISIENSKEASGDSISYTFSNKQQMNQKQVYNNEGKLKETTVYEYDTIGNRISMKATRFDGGRPFAIRFFYNRNGQLTHTKTTSSTEDKIEKYRYNELNFLIEAKRYSSNGSLWRQANYSYDGKGNLVLMVVKSNKGDTVTINKYSYNNLNQRVQREHSGEPVNCVGRNKWQIRYNEFGDIIEEKTSDLTIKYRYQYDDKKNWTKQYHFYNDETEPNFLTTRVITYRK